MKCDAIRYNQCSHVFQQVMNKLFDELDLIVVYLDDICILSRTKQKCKPHLTQVIEMISKHGIELRVDKCLWINS